MIVAISGWVGREMQARGRAVIWNRNIPNNTTIHLYLCVSVSPLISRSMSSRSPEDSAEVTRMNLEKFELLGWP